MPLINPLIRVKESIITKIMSNLFIAYSPKNNNFIILKTP